jgi:hypothetical protein
MWDLAVRREAAPQGEHLAERSRRLRRRFLEALFFDEWVERKVILA